MQKPVRSVVSQLRSAVQALEASRVKPQAELDVERMKRALKIADAELSELLGFHQWPNLDEMTREEIEEWMRDGAKPIAQTKAPGYFEHVGKLLSQMTLDAQEVALLGTDMDFLTMLNRLSPGTRLSQLTPASRAFVIYVQQMVGWDADQAQMDKLVWAYPRIVKHLEEAIEYEAIAILVKDPEPDWKEFFEAVVGEPPQQEPEDPREKFKRLVKSQQEKYKQLPDWTNWEPPAIANIKQEEQW